MKNLEDYHDLYNRVDVLLLSDVSETSETFVASIATWIPLTTSQHRV